MTNPAFLAIRWNLAITAVVLLPGVVISGSPPPLPVAISLFLAALFGATWGKGTRL